MTAAQRADGSPIDGSREPQDTLTFIKNPDLWPLGAVLPLVRREPIEGVVPFGDCGVMIAAPGMPRFTVFCGLNVVAHAGWIGALVASGVLPGPATHVVMREYPDAEGVIDDGWRVG